MLVLALDLATHCGVAFGDSRQGRPAMVERWNLNRTKPLGMSDIHRGPGVLAMRLRLLFRDHGIPDFAAIEQMMSPAAQPSDAVVMSQGLLHGAAKACMGVWGIDFRTPHCSTVRKHYCGRASAGNRPETKAMVVRRAQQLGHIAKDESNDDKADACALWDWAVHAHLRTTPGNFQLFAT